MFDDLSSVIVYRILFSIVFFVIRVFRSRQEEGRLRFRKHLFPPY